MLSGDVCCRVPYPPGRRSAFYRFIVSLSFIVLSLSLSKHRTFFGSIIFFFVERYIESFGRISNTNNTSRSWYKYVVHAFRVLVYCKHEHVRKCLSWLSELSSTMFWLPQTAESTSRSSRGKWTGHSKRSQVSLDSSARDGCWCVTVT